MCKLFLTFFLLMSVLYTISWYTFGSSIWFLGLWDFEMTFSLIWYGYLNFTIIRHTVDLLGMYTMLQFNFCLWEVHHMWQHFSISFGFPFNKHRFIMALLQRKYVWNKALSKTRKFYGSCFGTYFVTVVQFRKSGQKIKFMQLKFSI